MIAVRTEVTMLALGIVLVVGGIFGMGVWFTRICDDRSEQRRNNHAH